MTTLLWTEKYRPNALSECILPEALAETFKGFLRDGIPNLLLVGPPGTGKTSVARALCADAGADYMFVNASMDRNLDTLRVDIQKFASTHSLFSDAGGRKIVIFDEADYLNKTSTQPALRGFMETFADNCGFIMTCNYKSKLINPLWSRSTIIEFDFSGPEKKELAKRFFNKACDILQAENIEYSSRAVSRLILKHYPDFRRVLNELQRHAASGKIDLEVLLSSEELNINTLVNYIRGSNFTGTRKWCADNSSVETSLIISKLIPSLVKRLNSADIPAAIVILNEAQKADVYVADRELNLCSAFCELMLLRWNND